MLLFLALSACAPDATVWRRPAPDVVVEVESVTFPATPVGETATVTLTLKNRGAADATVSLSTGAPFDVDRGALHLGPDSELPIGVRFRPLGHGEVSGTLALLTDGGLATVPLLGAADPDGDADGHTAEAAGGDDCDDADPAVYPGAPDTCHDGVDADCALNDDDDCDGDGLPAGEDCDDDDPAVTPRAQADPENGADDDCDGLVDEDALQAGELFLSELSPESPPWVEVCSAAARDVPLAGLVVATAGGDAVLTGTLAPGACAAFCAWSVAGCAGVADVVLTEPEDRVVLSAGSMPLDAVAVTDAWTREAHESWAFDTASDSWCATTPTPSEANASCP